MCICASVYLCLCESVSMYVLSVRVSVCIYVSLCVYVCVCMSMCVYVYVSMCISVCVFVSAYVSVHNAVFNYIVEFSRFGFVALSGIVHAVTKLILGVLWLWPQQVWHFAA